MDYSLIALIVIPPALGGIIGYFTNWLAIRMLFRPYNKKCINIPSLNIKLAIPFTPGLFPKEQQRFAAKVAGTITQELLTPEDIRNITIKLVTPQNIEVGVDKIVDVLLTEFQNIKKLRNITEDIAQLIAAFLKQSMPDIIQEATKKSPLVKDILGKAFDTIILQLHIPKSTSFTLVSSLFDYLATPNTIRNWLLSILTRENIELINKMVQDNSSGSYFILTRIITAKSLLENVKDFLKNDPESANEAIQDTIIKLDLKLRLAESLSNINFQKLPYSTVSMLRDYFIEHITQYFLENSKQMSEKLSEEEMTTLLTEKILRFDATKVNPNTVNSIKREVSTFVSKYLERELGDLIEQAIPALGIEEVISSKVLKFSPQQLEKIITDISKKELKGIEILGGLLGFLIGCIQVIINLSIGLR